MLASGGVKCWGANPDYPLNNGNWHTPVDVVELGHDVRAVSNGIYPTCVLTVGGGVKCWGNNANGSVGDGTRVDRRIPAAVVGLATGVQALDAGARHTCAVLAAGGIRCWGLNYAGQLGDGTLAYNRLTPVAVWHLEDYDCAAVTEIPASECRALVTFFKATNGPLWREHTTGCAHRRRAVGTAWRVRMATSTHSTYRRITWWTRCRPRWADRARCKILDLHANELIGDLPPALSGLTALQTLDLSANQFSGVLPVGLRQLAALRTLDLSHNLLRGEIPFRLADLGQLTHLDLSANSLTGNLPFGADTPTALQYLDLSNNYLDSGMPWVLNDLRALTYLDLSHNALDWEIPWELGGLTALTYLIFTPTGSPVSSNRPWGISTP